MLKKLAKYVKGYTKHAALSPILMMGEVLMEVIIPLLLIKLINDGIYGENVKYIAVIGGLIAVCALFSLFFGAAAGRSAAIASAGFAKNLREGMFGRISRFSFRNIDKFSTSGLVTRLTTDVNRLQEAFHMIIRIAVRSPAMVVFSLVSAFTINPRLALIFLCAVPILGFGIGLIMYKAHPIFKRMFTRYDRLNQATHYF